MKIFLSYGHDSNAPLIHAIKEYLSDSPNGAAKHQVWIDTSEIKEGDDWRERITSGLLSSDTVLAGLSKYSTRDPGVCRDEILISVGVKGGNIKTVLLEPSDQVCPPAMISHIQWLDMSDWREHQYKGFDSDYFLGKFEQLRKMLETPENIAFEGEITRLKEYLKPISSISRIKSLTSKRMYGRQWIYDMIEEWGSNSTSRIFWIMAGPGFGKSMFAAHLSQKYNAYIPSVQFVEWGKPDHSNSRKILCNIAFYLAVRYPDYHKFLLANEHVLRHLDRMNEDELFDFLFCESTWMQIDGEHQNVWILIDALDEANDRYGNRIAQTLARHVDRLPRWLRFIITSRNDKKVSLPLEAFNPQVCDLEAITQENNLSDMKAFLRGELSGYNLEEDVYKALIDKCQNVFLYLSLLVEDFKKGKIDINQIDRLPNGLGAYYYGFFNRMFGGDLSFYYEHVAPLLQVYVASESELSYDQLKYLLKPTSESQFHRTLSMLDHLFVTKVDEDGTTRIAFFHNSIENWLTNYNAAGPYFISREDGQEIISQRFEQWIRSSDTKHDQFWSKFRNTVHCFTSMLESTPPSSLRINRERIQSIFERMHKSLSLYVELSENMHVEYLVKWINRSSEEKVLTALIVLYERILDSMIKIGMLSPETRAYVGDDTVPYSGMAIAQAIKNTEVLGFIGAYMAKSPNKYPYDLLQWLLERIRRLAFYDSCISHILPSHTGAGLEIFGNNISFVLHPRDGHSLGVYDCLERKIEELYPNEIANNDNLQQNKPYELCSRLEAEIFPDIFKIYQ